MRFAAIFLASMIGCGAAAADLALVIGNEEYQDYSDLRRGAEVVSASDRLEAAGVEVIAAENAELDEIVEAVARFSQEASEADSLLVVLSGRFLSTSQDAYLLPIEADDPSLALLPARTLPLSVLTAILAEAPGRSVMLIASDDDDAEAGDYLRTGPGDIEPPQGVTLVRADPRAARNLVRDVLSVPGRSLADGVAEIGGATISGFVARDFALLQERPDAEPRVDEPEEVEDPSDEAWAEARRRDTAAGYEDYLARYPRGLNAVEARLRLDELRRNPERRAEAAEEGLGLSREQRQQIQRDLSILGYNTRGIDGIFGEGTRGAIRGWQEEIGDDATGYLNASQIDRLSRAAQARSEELEREAAERREARDREDRAFWEETGATQTAEGYSRYLERFPDGLFSELAQDRLDEIAAERRRAADAADRAAWEQARAQDTPDAYRDYLRGFPGGAFRSAAEAALDQREGPSAATLEAQRGEQALGLNILTARLVEERLEALGLQPGPVDGAFDERTRRALRRYQSDRNLPDTGYLNEPTVVRLLADSVRQILE